MTNKYVEKLAEMEKIAEPISLALLHAGAVHVGQNLAIRQALNTKALAKHVAKGFSEGVNGTIDKSLKAHAGRALFGATLPEVNAMQNAARKAGETVSGSVKSLHPRQKVGLRMLSEGRVDAFKHHGFHEDKGVVGAYDALRTGYKQLPELNHVLDSGGAAFKDKKNPLISNIVKNISRPPKNMGKQLPGKAHAGSSIAGGLATMAVDPVAGTLNTAKNLAQSSRFNASKIGHAMTSKLEHMMAVSPAKKGWSNPDKTFMGPKNRVKELLLNPLETHISRASAAVSRAVKPNK